MNSQSPVAITHAPRSPLVTAWASTQSQMFRVVNINQVTSDWHNAYAQLVIELSNRLQGAPTDADRLAIINSLKAELGGDAVRPPPVVTQPGVVVKANGSGTVLHGEPGGE